MAWPAKQIERCTPIAILAGVVKFFPTPTLPEPARSGLRNSQMIQDCYITHNSIINWVKETGGRLSETEAVETIPEVSEIDEIHIFFGQKKDSLLVWTAVNHFAEGILAWMLGDRSRDTFVALWMMIKNWYCYFWVTDGYCVYPKYINSENHIFAILI